MKFIKNNLGFSLVEIMIAVALMGGLAVGVMNLTQNSKKQSAKFQYDIEITSIISEINRTLADPNKCLSSFGPSGTISALNGTVTNISGKFYTVSSGSAPANGYGNGAIEIISYQLQGTAVSLAAKSTDLIITFANKNIIKGQTGSTTLNKILKLYVEVDGSNKIIRCLSNLSSAGDGIWSRVAGNTSNIFYDSGNVGIGMNNPTTTLEVNGGIKPGNGTIGNACSPEGILGYDIAAHTPIFCNNLNLWASNGGCAGGVYKNMYQCPGRVSLGGGAWGYYGCNSQIQNQPSCDEIEYPTTQTFACVYIGKMCITP